MANSKLDDRRKKGLKLKDAYGGSPKTIDEMDEIAKSMAPAKPSISDKARVRYERLMRRRIYHEEASLQEPEIYGPRKFNKSKKYTATFRSK